MACNWYKLSELDRPGQTRISVEEFSPSQPKRETEEILGDLLLKQVADQLSSDYKADNENIQIMRQGQPKAVSDIPIYLSLSHTRGLICAAASINPVGIDCEHIRSFPSRLKEKFTSKEEINLFGSESNESLTQLWCAKEAVAKALGRGLERDFRTINISSSNNFNIKISMEKEKKEICHAAVEDKKQVFVVQFSKIGTAVVALAEQLM